VTEPGPPATEPVSILLVDDPPGNLLSLQAILERPDYDLVLVHDGREALAQLLRKDFAVILLDVATAQLDGFEVAAAIRRHEAYRTIPILFITASTQPIDWIFEGCGVGAVDFLQKPLDAQQVRAKVAVFVELFRQRREMDRQAERLREQERNTRELELERLRFQHERRFRYLAEALPDIVWVATGDGQIEYVNRRFSERTGADEEAAKGSGWLDFVHPDDADALRRHWNESVAAGQPFELEFRLRTSTGSFCWHRGRALPERDESHGGIARWVGTMTDVDEHRRAQDDLRAAVRMRDEFLAVASHELRTPLTSLKLRAESIRRGRDRMTPEKVEANLDQLVRQVQRLEQLVDRLLDVSRLTTHRLALKHEEIDLADVAREIARGLADEAARSGCTLQVLAGAPVRGTWDRLRIGQLITNQLGNAFKYGAGKPVELTVSAADDTACITVTDRGIGIPAEQVERIFGRFERAAPITNYAGLGLGLYVVAEIVEAHGGRIDLSTRPGEGTTFRVQLPRTPPPAQPGSG
jgi:PAS domain S-box-containing protein